MSEEMTYNLEEIIDFKSSIPNGEYVVKLIDVELGTYDGASTPSYLQATFSVQEGDLMGEDMSKRYSLKIFTTKNGATGCMGLADFRRECGKIGADSQLKQKFTAQELRKIYATIFGKKKLRILKTMEKDYKGTVTEDGTVKMWPRYNIIGLASQPHVAAGADPLADLGF
jgi:hypothetical protein